MNKNMIDNQKGRNDGRDEHEIKNLSQIRTQIY